MDSYLGLALSFAAEMQMEELNYILNNHTDLVFYLILAIIFGSVSARFLFRNLRRKNQRRRFDDR